MYLYAGNKMRLEAAHMISTVRIEESDNNHADS